MSNYSEVIHATPSEETVKHWNTTLQENAYQNKTWFDKLDDAAKEILVAKIEPIHYSEISNDGLVRMYEKKVKPLLKQPRTLKEIKEHPLTDRLWFEEFDQGEHYCVSLIYPYWFSCEESIWIHCKTVKELCDSFYPSIKKPY